MIGIGENQDVISLNILDFLGLEKERTEFMGAM
jgi:hypothetical protein